MYKYTIIFNIVIYSKVRSLLVVKKGDGEVRDIISISKSI